MADDQVRMAAAEDELPDGAEGSAGEERATAAAFSTNAACESPARPRPAGAPEPPAGYGGQANAGAKAAGDVPQSFAQTVRSAAESLPGMDDISMQAVDEVEPGRHRASPLSFIPAVVAFLPTVLFVLVIVISRTPALFSGGEGAFVSLLVVIGVGVALLVLAAAIALVSWYIHTWEIEDDALVLRTNFVVHTEKRIPYQRVHSIDLSAKIINRLLGLVTVSVDTGTGEPSHIEGMRRQDAEALKRTVFARKALLAKGTGAVETASQDAARDAAAPVPASGSAPASSPAMPDAVDFESRLTRRQYVIGALTSPSVGGFFVALLGLFGGLYTLVEYASDIFGEWVMLRFFGMTAQATAESTASFVRGADLRVLLVALVVFVVALVVVWVVSAVLSLIKWGNFVARRRGSRVEVAWGLLSRSARAVELSRVQVVTVRQSLLRRACGYAQVVVHTVSASLDDQGSIDDGVVVHPCIKLSEADAWIAEMLPEFAGACAAAHELHRLPPVALRRTLLRGVYWTALPAALAAAAAWLVPALRPDLPLQTAELLRVVSYGLWGVAAVTLVWGELVRVLAYRMRRIGIHDGRLLVTLDGALSRTVTVAARTKLQSLRVRRTPFQLRAGVATVAARTACVPESVDPFMRDVSDDVAEDIQAWARPRYHNEEEVARALAEAGLA